jgi:AraC-like DNA-binding protein
MGQTVDTTISEYAPSAWLSPFVQTYWEGTFNVSGEKNFSQSVLPNGCIELIVHLSNDHCLLARSAGEWSHSPELTLLGLFEEPYKVHFGRSVNVFGIRFYPDGVRHIFGIPPTEFLATFEDGISVFGKRLYELCNNIRSLSSALERVRAADRFLTHELGEHALSYDFTHLAMKIIRATHGVINYGDLVSQIPISTRQLQREFKKIYGITVRSYIRLTRINAIHRHMLLSQSQHHPLPAELEFFDQSHFIREFKVFTGVPPMKFIKARNHFIVNPK